MHDHDEIDHPYTIEELVKLAARAEPWLYADVPYGDHGSRTQQVAAAPWAIVAAAGLAARLGATGLVHEILQWSRRPPAADEPGSIEYDLGQALAGLVARGVEPDVLRPIARSPDKYVIKAMAKALDPQRPADLAILHEIAEDHRTEIATVARDRLGARHAWRWYEGLFVDDPELDRPPAIVAALQQAREALGLAQRAAKPTSWADLSRALSDVPDALAVPLLAAGLAAFAEHAPAIVAELHRRGGADAMLLALRRLARAATVAEHICTPADKWIPSLPDAVRVEVAQAIVPWSLGDGFAEAIAEPAPPPAKEDVRGTPSRRVAAFLVQSMWPPCVAPMPLIALVRDQQAALGPMHTVLRKTIDATQADLTAHADELEALLLEEPAYLQHWPHLWQHLADMLPRARLVVLVDRAFASADDELRGWAMEQRTRRAAPEDVPARTALLQSWLDDETLHDQALSSARCRACLLPELRRRLVAGRLSFAAAIDVVASIDALYGGAEYVGFTAPARVPELELAAQREQARAELGQWLDPDGRPPTATEWTEVRRLARAMIDEDLPTPLWWRVFAVLPLGPWRAEDLALFDAMQARAQVHFHALVLYTARLLEVSETKPPPDAIARMQWLLERVQPRDDDWSRRSTQELHAAIAELGGSAPEAAEPRSEDWMDLDP